MGCLYTPMSAVLAECPLRPVMNVVSCRGLIKCLDALRQPGVLCDTDRPLRLMTALPAMAAAFVCVCEVPCAQFSITARRCRGVEVWLHSLNLGARWSCVISCFPRVLYPRYPLDSSEAVHCKHFPSRTETEPSFPSRIARSTITILTEQSQFLCGIWPGYAECQLLTDDCVIRKIPY